MMPNHDYANPARAMLAIATHLSHTCSTLRSMPLLHNEQRNRYKQLIFKEIISTVGGVHSVCDSIPAVSTNSR